MLRNSKYVYSKQRAYIAAMKFVTISQMSPYIPAKQICRWVIYLATYLNRNTQNVWLATHHTTSDTKLFIVRHISVNHVRHRARIVYRSGGIKLFFCLRALQLYWSIQIFFVIVLRLYPVSHMKELCVTFVSRYFQLKYRCSQQNWKPPLCWYVKLRNELCYCDYPVIYPLIFFLPCIWVAI